MPLDIDMVAVAIYYMPITVDVVCIDDYRCIAGTKINLLTCLSFTKRHEP